MCNVHFQQGALWRVFPDISHSHSLSHYTSLPNYTLAYIFVKTFEDQRQVCIFLLLKQAATSHQLLKGLLIFDGTCCLDISNLLNYHPTLHVHVKHLIQGAALLSHFQIRLPFNHEMVPICSLVIVSVMSLTDSACFPTFWALSSVT